MCGLSFTSIIHLSSHFYFKTYRNHARNIFKKKNRWFLKIPKWQNKLVRKYRRGKLFFSFINNAANTCSYDLKISRDIEILYVFHFKAFFHPFNNFHRVCLSAFKVKLCSLERRPGSKKWGKWRCKALLYIGKTEAFISTTTFKCYETHLNFNCDHNFLITLFIFKCYRGKLYLGETTDEFHLRWINYQTFTESIM